MKKTEQQKWQAVMKLAEGYGFIVQAHAGVATLATHQVQKDELGEERHQEIQKMNGRRR